MRPGLRGPYDPDRPARLAWRFARPPVSERATESRSERASHLRLTQAPSKRSAFELALPADPYRAAVCRMVIKTVIGPLGAAQVAEPVDEPDEHCPADHVAKRRREKVAEHPEASRDADRGLDDGRSPLAFARLPRRDRRQRRLIGRATRRRRVASRS